MKMELMLIKLSKLWQLIS